MKAEFKRAAPYADDALNLPVADVEGAIPYYEKRLGFRVVSRHDLPHKSVLLARDQVQIGLAENGGDPTQEGCFFEWTTSRQPLKRSEELRRKSLIYQSINLPADPTACSSKLRPMDCAIWWANRYE